MVPRVAVTRAWVSPQPVDQHNVEILMTLTTPNCPIAEDMPGIVQEEVSRVEGVGKVKVELTFEPPWDMANLSEEAKVELGLI